MYQDFQALKKYIHPTRYRQIIETESATMLNVEEQHTVSEDQKHSSNVARVHYWKLRSGDLALKALMCMEKLRGRKGKEMDSCVKQLIEKMAEKASGRQKLQRGSIADEASGLDKTRVSQRKIPVKFTTEEDGYVRRGLE